MIPQITRFGERGPPAPLVAGEPHGAWADQLGVHDVRDHGEGLRVDDGNGALGRGTQRNVETLLVERERHAVAGTEYVEIDVAAPVRS
jgi:hypothetical protein